MFASLQSAEEFLRNKLQDFYNQRGVLAGRLTAIEKLKQAALAKNDQQALGQLIVMRESVKNLLTEQLNLEDRLEPFRSYFGVTIWRPTLGALPIFLAAGAVAVATALYLHYEKLKNQATALDLIARGILPPDQADKILNPSFFSMGSLGGSFAQIGLFAIGGVVLYFFLTSRRTA